MRVWLSVRSQLQWLGSLAMTQQLITVNDSVITGNDTQSRRSIAYCMFLLHIQVT